MQELTEAADVLQKPPKERCSSKAEKKGREKKTVYLMNSRGLTNRRKSERIEVRKGRGFMETVRTENKRGMMHCLS